uniref:Glycogen debranching enzyme (Alpha-1,6-glucosidase) n=1 Tax=Candidatus Kentrum sp. DK TaxID=2126562 RepID=A0A450S017_9GAMM|nr:MAG: Glycogen debranching enzyme (alpha-1,6-glucosidase) [Candidatus Kentron sp. DK]
MKDVIRYDNAWYVLATSSRADDRTRTLKQGETFVFFDRFGDIQDIGAGDQGLYHEGTRFLSYFELTLNDDGLRPALLYSTVKSDNSELVVDLTNPDLWDTDPQDLDPKDPGAKDNKRLLLPKGTLHLARSKVLGEGVHYERLLLNHYGDSVLPIRFEFRFEADYADIFEVRGAVRPRRGRKLPPVVTENGVVLGYEGLDGVRRQTRIVFSQKPDFISENHCRYVLQLPPRTPTNLYITVACEYAKTPAVILDYGRAEAASRTEVPLAEKRRITLTTTNEQFNDWINRSAADLNMLISETPYGPYPYAGVPWFSTPFGRDGIITALQYLWLAPWLAKGVLGFLAATQATSDDPERDAEPGKIVHEIRQGEMAALNEVPFARYYGSVDATPLFIVLAGAYYDRTGDRQFLKQIWPNIGRAMDWIDQYGDQDGDGFVEYLCRSSHGLPQQGWKDSNDSIFHQDGQLAEAPIALAEVQGYVFDAKRRAAVLARIFGEEGKAEEWERQADQLKTRFHKAFWCEDIGTYAIALDKDKRPCRVRSSNAGHTLFSGIASTEHAPRLVETLFHPDSFSGWGIRTIARHESRYNPMSYHNGAIWPHDNAIIAMGLARYGYKSEALRITTGLFNASIMMDLHRLPELFCGFDYASGQGPVLYPVACSPQAWASGAVFHLLQAALGIDFSTERPQLRFSHPQLPDYLKGIRVDNLPAGDGVVDFSLQRYPRNVGINVSRKVGDVEVSVRM